MLVQCQDMPFQISVILIGFIWRDHTTYWWLVIVLNPADTRHAGSTFTLVQWLNAPTAHRRHCYESEGLRSWVNISPVSGYRVVFDATLNVGQRHRRWANTNPAFVFYSNRPKSLKNKQKTANRHTGTLEWGTQQALVHSPHIDVAQVSPL